MSVLDRRHLLTGKWRGAGADPPPVVFHAEACWARQGIDPGCDYCFDRCPARGTAITYQRARGPRLNAGACTGCGKCVYFCPAQPKAFSLATA